MRYPDYQIANIAILAESILVKQEYTGENAQRLIDSCEVYATTDEDEHDEAGAFDGLIVHGDAVATLKDMDNDGLGRRCPCARIAPSD